MEENKLVTQNELAIEDIKNLIYTIRGKQVMIDSDVAISVSVNIMKAFIEMRKFLMINGQVFGRLTSIEHKLLEHDKKFDEVFNQLQQEENIKQKIFFEGQIYDAYILIIDIINKVINL